MKRIILFILLITLIPLPLPKIEDAKIIIENFDVLLQNPELPTGCEVTSLTAVLNYYGYVITKTEMADHYLSKQRFYKKDGIYYGADFNTTFAGDPRNPGSYGCKAGCIEKAAMAYVCAEKIALTVTNVTGAELKELLTYINKSIPVIIWITMDLNESHPTTKWTTPEGEKVQWMDNEHCVVLIGYTKDQVICMDPVKGITYYNKALFESRYIQMGKNAVVISKTPPFIPYNSEMVDKFNQKLALSLPKFKV